jgi:hypothetical protein
MIFEVPTRLENVEEKKEEKAAVAHTEARTSTIIAGRSRY